MIEPSICCLEKTISGESHDQTLETIESPASISYDQLIPISNTDADDLTNGRLTSNIYSLQTTVGLSITAVLLTFTFAICETSTSAIVFCFLTTRTLSGK